MPYRTITADNYSSQYLQALIGVQEEKKSGEDPVFNGWAETLSGERYNGKFPSFDLALKSVQDWVDARSGKVTFVFYNPKDATFEGGHSIPYLSNIAHSDIDERIDHHFKRNDGMICYFRSQIEYISSEQLLFELLQQDNLSFILTELQLGTYAQITPGVWRNDQSSTNLSTEDIKVQITNFIKNTDSPSRIMLQLINQLHVSAEYQLSVKDDAYWKFSLI